MANPNGVGGFQNRKTDINTNGRKPGSKNWGTVIKEQMRKAIESGEKSTQENIVRVLIKSALEGNLKAIEMLMDRTDGKPQQKMELEDKPRKISDLSREETIALATELRRQSKQDKAKQSQNTPETLQEAPGGD